MLDVGALGHQGAFVAAEEVDAVVHVGVQEDVGRAEREAAAEGEVLPVASRAEGPKERDRGAGDDAEADGVAGTNQRRGLLDTHLARRHRPILPERSRCANDLAVSESFVIDVWSDVVCPFCYLGSRQLA